MKTNLFVLVLVALLLNRPVYADSYEATGSIPVRVEAHGPLYFGPKDNLILNALGSEYAGKVSVIRFASEWVQMDVRLKDSNAGNILMWGKYSPLAVSKDKQRFYFKVLDKHGKDVTRESIGILADTEAQKEQIARKEGVIFSANLPVGDYLLVNFYDNTTDSLVKTYYLEREAMPLQLKSYRTYDGGEVLIRGDVIDSSDSAGFVKVTRYDEVIQLSPGQALRLVFGKPATVSNASSLDLSYRLENNRDEEVVEETSKNEIILKGLTAGTDYTLTVWYSLQPDDQYRQRYRIAVLPYWYQTSRFQMILGGLLFAALGCAFLFVMVIRLKRAKSSQSETEQQLLSVQAQLNPHFIFNALSSIQGLNNTGRIEEANRYLGEFSSLLRSTLQSSEKITNTLDKELETLKTYLSLEKLRFGFQWKMEVAESVNPVVLNIPTLLLQPLVENAVKHGVSGLGKEGEVHLRVLRQGNDLLVYIQDNGMGFAEGLQEGYGIRLTRDRIKLFNRLSKENQINLIFESNEGTTAKILFSKWFN